ncbi:hypothetical protein [Kineosporia succinea]|uniref:Reprolysin-like metallo-peptidase family M12B n=1 Tax=Kineosporia succinea TaxID=84632 RepID=A0ABT9P512_9ACTN|nr:hypothetical protein [Kineosporia succinea]MDP9827783.1 hypothetical protein [Kineosporia succinea]
MKTWLLRLGGPALIPVVGLLLCLALVPFAPRAGASPSAAETAPPPSPTPVTSTSPAPVGQCADDSTAGKRVLALYVRGDDQSDRFAANESRFRSWLDTVDRAFVYSSRINGGGWRKVRWARDAMTCQQVVEDVVVPQTSMEDTDTITAALKAQGYDRADRKYVVWYDQAGCGVGFGAGGNDLPDWYNLYNYGPHYAMIGTSCWSWSTTLHELLHTLGAVNPSAPHASEKGHCWDANDVLCYDDEGLPAGGLKQVCKLPARASKAGLAANVIDCNGDDYFNTAPPAGSYLATHWNVADSEFLYDQEPVKATAGSASAGQTQQVPAGQAQQAPAGQTQQAPTGQLPAGQTPGAPAATEGTAQTSTRQGTDGKSSPPDSGRPVEP